MLKELDRVREHVFVIGLELHSHCLQARVVHPMELLDEAYGASGGT